MPSGSLPPGDRGRSALRTLASAYIEVADPAGEAHRRMTITPSSLAEFPSASSVGSSPSQINESRRLTRHRIVRGRWIRVGRMPPQVGLTSPEIRN